MEQETKLVPPSTPAIEVEETRENIILKFESNSIDYNIISIICGALRKGLLDCKCTIRATGIYNQLEIEIDHYLRQDD